MISDLGKSLPGNTQSIKIKNAHTMAGILFLKSILLRLMILSAIFYAPICAL